MLRRFPTGWVWRFDFLSTTELLIFDEKIALTQLHFIHLPLSVLCRQRNVSSWFGNPRRDRVRLCSVCSVGLNLCGADDGCGLILADEDNLLSLNRRLSPTLPPLMLPEVALTLFR